MTLREKYRPAIQEAIAAAAGAPAGQVKGQLDAAFPGNKASYQFEVWCHECGQQLRLGAGAADVDVAKGAER